MPLDFKFTLAQSADCKTLTFTETTGNGAGGYGDGGNPLYTDVRNTQLTILLPNGDTVLLDKGYLPTTDADPNGTFDFVAGDIGFSNFLDGVWDVTTKVYTTDTASGSILAGVEYIVTGTGASITYDGNTYLENMTFTGTTETDYVENAPSEVNVFHTSKQCNFLIYCGVRGCLKTLMLSRCDNNCDCRDDFHEAMNELIIDFNAAQLAFNEQNYKCANDTLIRLGKNCSSICNDCGC
jgi:hypothetical protein